MTVCILVHGIGPAISTKMLISPQQYRIADPSSVLWLRRLACAVPHDAMLQTRKGLTYEWYYVTINIKSALKKERQESIQHTFLEMSISLLISLGRLDLHISLFSTLMVVYTPCKASVLAVSSMRMHRYPVCRSLRCLQTIKKVYT